MYGYIHRQHMASTLLSCQISTTVQERVPLGNETISFTTDLEEVIHIYSVDVIKLTLCKILL